MDADDTLLHEPDVCACDVCQPMRDYHELSTEEKFALAWP